MNKLTVTALALVALGAVSTMASAQDAVLSFRIDNTTGTGVGVDLEVDLGETTSYFNSLAPGTVVSLNTTTANGETGLSVNDLIADYGSTWYSDTNLVWGVSGLIGSGKFDATSSVGPQQESSQGTLIPIASRIGSVDNELNSELNSNGPTPYSNTAVNMGTPTDPATGSAYNGISYNSLLNTDNNAKPDFGYFVNGTTEIHDGPEGAGTPVGTLAFYEYLPANQLANSTSYPDGPLEGTFSLDASGDFTYTAASVAVAIPEPSTYAMLIGSFGLLFFVLRLRRNSTLG